MMKDEGLYMAKIERVINRDFDQLLSTIEDGIINGSVSASLEDSSDFRSQDARCSVRVFERYSYTGGNRVSLNVTLFQNGEEPVHLSAITAGGSQAVFFKLNTFGEEAFLDKLIELLDQNKQIFSKVFFMLEIKHTSCFYNAIILSET